MKNRIAAILLLSILGLTQARGQVVSNPFSQMAPNFETPSPLFQPIQPEATSLIRPNPASCEFYLTPTRSIESYWIWNEQGTLIATGKTSSFEELKFRSCKWPNGQYYIWVEGIGKELLVIHH